MTLESFILAMPKIELHVHLEGSIRPETLLKLAQRHAVALPADSVEGLRTWYTFTDFDHFIEVYLTIATCLRTPEDIELVAREFLAGQAAQNIMYSEVTYTALLQWRLSGIPFGEQLAAINRARAWAASTMGVTMTLVLDIPRDVSVDEGLQVAEWAIAGQGDGVVALGLAGPEQVAEPAKFRSAFDRARAAGLRRTLHAGEHDGPASIWGCLRDLGAERIGHGVRCLEDSALVEELRARQIPLEVCPTSNVCLGVASSWPTHPFPRLIEAGLYVTLNSDDPPLFNTTLTGEYQRAAQVFGLDGGQIETLSRNALRATFLPPAQRAALGTCWAGDFERLRAEHLE